MPKSKRKPAPKPRSRGKSPASNEIEFSIKPGEKTTLTIEAGEEHAGEVPVRIRVDGGKAQTIARQVEIEKETPAVVSAWLGSFRKSGLAMWLFIGAIVLYVAMRFVGLTQYPIYFFTDEAFQTQAMVELIERDYVDVRGTKFPAYFGNGMGLTVYLQWLPYLLFGKSAFLTRAVSAIITVIAAVSVGIILRDIFKAKYWWSGVLLLSMTPAWFLHSRTAFETAPFAAFYAGALCAYLFYRYRSPRYLYLTVFLASLAFYSYNPAQLMVPVTGLVLLISDWRYHNENQGTAIRAGFLLAILAIPYIRFKIEHLNSADEILRLLGSYLVADIPISQKISTYITEYFFGLSAYYWYAPNDRDLVRHLMKDYGHIMLATLPFAMLGLVHFLRNWRESAHRAILLVIVVIPLGGAMVQAAITRGLVFVIPAAILTAIGLDHVLRWVESPRDALKGSTRASKPTKKQVDTSVGILFAGVILALLFDRTIDRISVLVLAILLGFHGLGYFEKLRQFFRSRFKGWKVSHSVLSLAVFAVLSIANIRLLTDALKNGPLWWTEYGMGGMQYGAFQIYDAIEEYHRANPQTRFVFSSNWANGADVLNRFFIGVQPWLDGGSIEGYIQRKRPVDENTLFIMVPYEYTMATESPKLTDIRVEQIIPYPDGTPAFYFVRLRYVDIIDEIFAAERAERAVLREAAAIVEGQQVNVRFSYLDAVDQAHSIQEIFDNDIHTLAKTLEDNPFIVELAFPSPRVISGFSIIIGSAHAQITVKCYSALDSEPVIYSFEGKGSEDEPMLSFDFPEPVHVEFLHFEMLDPHSPPPSQIHIWELNLQFSGTP